MRKIIEDYLININPHLIRMNEINYKVYNKKNDFYGKGSVFKEPKYMQHNI